MEYYHPWPHRLGCAQTQHWTIGREPLSYNANGNLTSAPGLSLRCDSWNRLISAATESNLVLFAYDGRHRCVKRVEIQNGIGRATIMVWGHEPSQGWGLLEERGPNGELIARHVHGISVDDLVLFELDGAVYYYHHDHLSSTIAVTDESGHVVERYRYDVYGQPYFFGPDGAPRSESPLGIRFLFTGREWLGSVGLYDYRHRAYSPSLGRFLQMDWFGLLEGVNHFCYCNGMPTVLVDPLGLSSRDVVRILKAFDDSIDEMVSQGKRLPGRGRIRGGWNNLNRLWNPNIYLCADQANYLKRRLDALRRKLDDTWEIEEVFSYRLWDVIPIPWPAHAYLVARSSRPADPILKLDPQRSEIWISYPR